jgi:hypothetical protein
MGRFNSSRPGPISAAIAGNLKQRGEWVKFRTVPLIPLIGDRWQSVLARFFSRVAPDCECIVWIGKKCANGYGRFKLRKRDYFAHRVAWVLANQREIAPGMFVCHSCDNRACVNPSHLWIGSNRDNMIDMYAKGRGAPTRARDGRVIAAEITPHFIAHSHGGR